MSHALHKIKEEFLAMLPPTIFFFVALHVVALVRTLMIKATGVLPLTTVTVAISALVLGKAVLIADMLPWINRYPEKPLIYNVAWKTLIYTLVSAMIHYLEHLYDFAREAGGVAAGNAKLIASIIWPHFWAIQIILFMLILGYCIVCELMRVVGKERMLRTFFGPLPLPKY